MYSSRRGSGSFPYSKPRDEAQLDPIMMNPTQQQTMLKKALIGLDT